ncbi:MAG: hypothetical protein ABEI99_09100 [Halobaculum sp.]
MSVAVIVVLQLSDRAGRESLMSLTEDTDRRRSALARGAVIHTVTVGFLGGTLVTARPSLVDRPSVSYSEFYVTQDPLTYPFLLLAALLVLLPVLEYDDIVRFVCQKRVDRESPHRVPVPYSLLVHSVGSAAFLVGLFVFPRQEPVSFTVLFASALLLYYLLHRELDRLSTDGTRPFGRID